MDVHQLGQAGASFLAFQEKLQLSSIRKIKLIAGPLKGPWSTTSCPFGFAIVVLNEALIRGTASTRGVDNVNNVGRITDDSLTSGLYKVTVTHADGLAGNPVN